MQFNNCKNSLIFKLSQIISIILYHTCKPIYYNYHDIFQYRDNIKADVLKQLHYFFANL